MRRLITGIALTACAAGAALGIASRGGSEAATAARAPVVTPAPLAQHPHATDAYTEGLVWLPGDRIFESTGLYGASSLRQVRRSTGAVIRSRSLSGAYFGEGLAATGSRLIQLTWKENTAFVWDRRTFRRVRTFRYAGEGWGLTTTGGRLVMSNGSAVLRFLDPATFREVRRVRVTDGGRPVTRLNELEAVRGEIWANVWQRDDIVVIDPATGRVRARLDLSGLRSRLPAGGQPEVLNGIAWDRARDRVLVTGKYWPLMFELPSRELGVP
ncbi:MAG: glutaminyl-peptide cyclotransferase [Thermoleophilia bacterium]